MRGLELRGCWSHDAEGEMKGSACEECVWLVAATSVRHISLLIG